MSNPTAIVQENIPAAEYVDTFNVIKSICNERQVLLEYLKSPPVLGLKYAGCTLNFLSVGAGSGDFDFALMESWLKNGAQEIVYTAVEPSNTYLEALTARAAQDSRIKLVALSDTFQQTALTAEFDFILFMHSLYYMDDKTAALKKAVARLKSQTGVMVLIHQGTQGVSLIQKHFVSLLNLKKDPGMAAESLLNVLDEVGSDFSLDYKYQVVSTTIETTAVLDNHSSVGLSLFRFLLNVDASRLSEKVMQSFRRFVEELSYVHQGRFFMHQPLGVQIVRRR